MLPGGCASDATEGYTTKSPYRCNVQTVAVPIWQRGKDVYRRDIEFDLTEAIVKRIEADTPYKVVSREKADTELTGTIERIEQQVTSYDPNTGVPRELLVTMTVAFTWKDLRLSADKVVLAESKKFEVMGSYIRETPVGQEFFQGEQDVVNRLAKRIVEQMESDW